MWQGKGIEVGLCYRVEQDALFSKMSLDAPREAHVFEMSNVFQGGQVVAERVGAIIFRIESYVGCDTRQDMIASEEKTVTLTEEADMSIRVSRSPNDTIALTQQVNIFTVLNVCDDLTW